MFPTLMKALFLAFDCTAPNTSQKAVVAKMELNNSRSECTSVNSSTISHRWLTPAVETLVARGEHLGQMCSAVCISRANLKTDKRMPLAQCDAICSRICSETGDGEFWIRASEHLEASTYGLVSYLLETSQTAAAMAELFAQYAVLCCSRTLLRMHVAGQLLQARVALSTGRESQNWQAFILGTHLATLRRHFGGTLCPVSVNFTGPRPSSTENLERVFGVIPRFGRVHASLAIPFELLAGPVRTADPWLHKLLLERASLEMGYHASKQSLADHLAAQFRCRDLRQVSLGTFAKSLGLSRRSAQRLLAAENTTFQQVLNASRVEQAVELFTRYGRTVHEASVHLGFSSEAAFRRAFKRGTGIAAGQFRRSQPLE